MTEAPPGGADPNASVLHLLHRARQSANTLLARELARHRMTPRQFVLMQAIAANPDCRQTDLGSETGVDRSTVAGIVARLAERGLVERAAAAEDRRARSVRLTTTGRQLLRRCRQGAAAAERDLLERLPSGDRRRFQSALEILAGVRPPDPPRRGRGPRAG